MAATLYVCTTCRMGEPVPDDGLVPGALLHQALLASPVPGDVCIVPVECLSACNTGCAVSLAQAGAWTYVYGRLTPADAPEILRGAGLYALTADGIVPWRDRPTIFRKQSIARIPPMEAAE